MKLHFSVMTGLVFCLSLAAQSMIIYNDSQRKDEFVRNESGVFLEDYLFLGHELNFTGQAEDLVFLGKRLTMNGTTTLGVIALGEKLFFSGVSGNGLIAGGVDVAIQGAMTGNSYIGSKTFTLGEGATQKGNLFIGCGTLTLDGTLNGDLYAGAGKIVINNEVNGNVTARSGRIIIGEKGKINGTLNYSSDVKLTDRELSRVTGAVTFDASHKFYEDWNSSAESWNSVGRLIYLILWLSFTVVGLVLLFMPAFRKLNAIQSAKTFLNNALWGLIPVLMYPAAIVLCIAMIVTIPFALVLILACIPLFFFANLIGMTLSGKYLTGILKWKTEKRHIHFIIGALACLLVSFIPIVNFLAFIFVSALGWGTYISFLFGKSMNTENKIMALPQKDGV